MTDSILPESDREWLANLIRSENEKLDRKIGETKAAVSELSAQVNNLEARQQRSEAAWRDSTVTDLDHERRIADAQLRLERMGATAGAAAGKESAEATSKKWGVVYALIALVHALVSTLSSSQKEIPPVVIPRESNPAPKTGAQ